MNAPAATESCSGSERDSVFVMFLSAACAPIAAPPPIASSPRFSRDGNRRKSSAAFVNGESTGRAAYVVATARADVRQGHCTANEDCASAGAAAPSTTTIVSGRANETDL